MATHVTCPFCRHRFHAPDGPVVREVECPECREQFLTGLTLDDDVDSAATSRPRVAPVQITPVPARAPRPVSDEDLDEEPMPRRRPRQRYRDRPRRIETPPRPKTSTVKPLVFALLAIFAIIVPIVWLALRSSKKEQNPKQPWGGVQQVQREADAFQRQEGPKAFPIQKPLTEAEIANEVGPLLASLAQAFRDRDKNRLMELYDVERLYDEMAGIQPLKIDVRSQPEFVNGMRLDLGDNLRQFAVDFDWTELEIKSLRKLQNNEAAVVARHRTRAGRIWGPMRWWVSKRSGAWKIFDHEFLYPGVRNSVVIRAGTPAGHPQTTKISRAIDQIYDANRALSLTRPFNAEKHVAEAKRLLGLAKGVQLPREVEAIRWLITGRVHLQHGRAQEALDAFEQASALNSDIPTLELSKAGAFNHLQQYDKALKSLEAYRLWLDEDASSCYEQGEALRGLRRFAEARAAYRKSLDEDPTDAYVFQGLLWTFAQGERRDDLAARFAKLELPHKAFDHCAEDCRQAKDGESLEQLVLAMGKIDPKHKTLDYYAALAYGWMGRGEQAAARFQAALAVENDPEKRRNFIQDFLQAMGKSGQAVRAYNVAPDPDEAFRLLAAELKKSFFSDDLRQLVTAHAKKRPGDPLPLLYQADAHVQDGNYLLANKAAEAARRNRA